MHCAFILYSSYQELRKLQPHRNEEIEKVDNFSSVTWHTLNKVNRALDLLKIKKKTRLTYNCAHLRSTEESLTLKHGTGLYLVVLGQYGEKLVYM